MGTFTKLFLTGLGWTFGGPIGALLGYFIGNAISSNKQIGGSSYTGTDDNSERGSSTSRRHGRYHNTGTVDDVNVALMVLIAALMKADGNVKRSELDYVKRFLLTNYGEERGKEMLKVLQQMVEKDIPINQVCSQIKVNTDYVTRYHMLDFLFGLGGADGEFHIAEISMLRLMGQYLGISTSDYASIYERHVGSSYSTGGGSHSKGSTSGYTKDPYKVLGIDSNATDDEVRKAYRKMAMKYHPDRVASMSEELQRNASEQMKEINEAYEVIKERRGIK